MNRLGFQSKVWASMFGWFLSVLITGAIAADNNAIPLPTLSVGKAVVPPTLDGVMAPGEWDRATAASAFVLVGSPALSHVQSVVWVMYDDTYFYVCFKNYRAERNVLLSMKARGNDDINIVFDHANEIWFSPSETPAPTYQSMFNAYPAMWDVKKIPTVGHTQMSWSGKWEMKSTETHDSWIVEGRAPIASFSATAVGEGVIWRGLFTQDDLAGSGGGFTAWAPGGAFEVIDRHGWLNFHNNVPVFQLLDVESIFIGKVDMPIAVTGPITGNSTVDVTARFGAAVAAEENDLVVKSSHSVEAGKRVTASIKTDLTERALPKNKEGQSQGICELTAKTRDGVVLYHQVFPFVIDGFVRKPPAELKASPYETPFGVSSYYAPLSKKLIIKVDRYYMKDRESATTGMVQLVNTNGQEVLIKAPLAAFINDYSETVLDAGKLKAPMQTEENWQLSQQVRKKNAMIVEVNKKLKANGEQELPLEPDLLVVPLQYPLEVTLSTTNGAELAKVKSSAGVLDYTFEWLGNNIGISDKVIPPWTPMNWSNGQVTMWNKAYRLNALGLAQEVVNDGRPQFSSPMTMVAVIGGKEVEVKAGPHRLVKLTDAAADFASTTSFGDLDIEVNTRVEFDGFVLNRMQLKPKKPVTLERLSLVVRMPKKESECFCTTAGGWSATAGFTPDVWDASSSASGSRYGSFVPYVFLTDSDRGFCWFADNDKGWEIDPKVPEQDLRVEGDIRTFRAHFIGKTVTLQAPRAIEYGWQVTPQKPQPPRWRTAVIHYALPYPMAEGVFYRDADRVRVWDYYSSPYPADMKKSRAEIEASSGSGIVPCPGNVGESIGHWRDYKGRDISVLGPDWAVVPGGLRDGVVSRGKGPNDFQIWHFDRWIREARIPGLYFDINYLSEEWNYNTGSAYFLPDGHLQPGYSYLGLREFQKRLRYVFNECGMPLPNIWMHTTLGMPVYAWMPDVAMEGENVHPTGRQYDYQDAAHAGRLRSIVMGKQLGAVPTLMAQAGSNPNHPDYAFMMRQLIGWLQAHDCLPNNVDFWPVLASELEVWHDDIRFLPYWKQDQGIVSLTEGVIVSAHVRPGHAVLWINNTLRKDLEATVTVDFKKLGLDPKKVVAFDAETGLRVDVAKGRLVLPVDSRLWRAIRLQEVRELTGDITFVAHFDRDYAVADEAFGNRYPLINRPDVPRACGPGFSGNGLLLDAACNFSHRQHLSAAGGGISLRFNPGAVVNNGSLLRVGSMSLLVTPTAITLNEEVDKKTVVAGTVNRALVPNTWALVEVSWKGKEISVRIDGAPAIAATLTQSLPIPADKRGVEIKPIPPVTFGPVPGASLDDLMMRK